MFLLIGFALSLLGLALDVYGFIMIFFIKPNRIAEILPISIMANRTDDNELSILENSINDRFENFNLSNESNDKKSIPYFIAIVIGFVFQFSGTIITYIASSYSCTP